MIWAAWLIGTVIVAVVAVVMILHARTLRVAGSDQHTAGVMALALCWSWPIVLAFLPVGFLGLFLADLFEKWNWI